VFSVRQKVSFLKILGSIIILYRFKTFKQVSIFVQTVQAIYLHKQHSSSNKMRFTAITLILNQQESVIEAATLTKAAMMLTLLTSPLRCAL
jgi:hypothetical protein